jgi:hypothetical protein
MNEIEKQENAKRLKKDNLSITIRAVLGLGAIGLSIVGITSGLIFLIVSYF